MGESVKNRCMIKNSWSYKIAVLALTLSDILEEVRGSLANTREEA